MTTNLAGLQKPELAAKIQTYLQELCARISNRQVGSLSNRAATDFFARTMAAFGFETRCPEFECIDWEHGGVQLPHWYGRPIGSAPPA